MTYKNIQITAVDSIAKKIRAVQTFKDKLHIENLTPICARVENLDEKFQYHTITYYRKSPPVGNYPYFLPKEDCL